MRDKYNEEFKSLLKDEALALISNHRLNATCYQKIPRNKLAFFLFWKKRTLRLGPKLYSLVPYELHGFND